ncbi:MAG TPA: hypothetical protein PKG48_03995, partial [Bacteroidales bacterium]|nr:hypothetical protein [Bacteroidales bacterium]
MQKIVCIPDATLPYGARSGSDIAGDTGLLLAGFQKATHRSLTKINATWKNLRGKIFAGSRRAGGCTWSPTVSAPRTRSVEVYNFRMMILRRYNPEFHHRRSIR